MQMITIIITVLNMSTLKMVKRFNKILIVIKNRQISLYYKDMDLSNLAEI